MFVNIFAFYLVCSLVVEHTLTLVSGIEPVAASKGVAGNITMVFAAFALQLFGFIMSQIQQLIDGS